jgi:hypothetical protein
MEIFTTTHSHTCKYSWIIDYNFISQPLETHHLNITLIYSNSLHILTTSHLSYIYLALASFTNISSYIYAKFNVENQPRLVTHHLYLQIQIRSASKNSNTELEWGWPKNILREDPNKSQCTSTHFPNLLK